MLLDLGHQQDLTLLLFGDLKGVGARDPLALSYARQRSRRARLPLIYEIPLSEQILQTPWMCNRRYKRRCSTCLDVSPLPHLFQGDRVPVSEWVQLAFGFCCCERGLLNVFPISISIHPFFAIQADHLGCSLAHPSILNRTVPWRCSVTLIWVRPRLDWSIISLAAPLCR